MGVTREVFYDPKQIAILPMAFCYPDAGKSGDLPPRPECAPAWRTQLLTHLCQLTLTLLIGQYAQAYHLDKGKASVTETVKSWRTHRPTVVPLPHPSPRNNIWRRRQPWFHEEVLPSLRTRVSEALAGDSG